MSKRFRCQTCCMLLSIEQTQEIECPTCCSVYNYKTADNAIWKHKIRYGREI